MEYQVKKYYGKKGIPKGIKEETIASRNLDDLAEELREQLGESITINNASYQIYDIEVLLTCLDCLNRRVKWVKKWVRLLSEDEYEDKWNNTSEKRSDKAILGLFEYLVKE